MYFLGTSLRFHPDIVSESSHDIIIPALFNEICMHVLFLLPFSLLKHDEDIL